jgi:hypothetical protein
MMSRVAELEEPLIQETDVRPHFGNVTPRTIARWREKWPDLWRPDMVINGRRHYKPSTIRRIRAAMSEAAA